MLIYLMLQPKQSRKHTKLCISVNTKARFPLVELTTARVDGQWKPVIRQLGSLTRAVNLGSGNRA